MKNADTRYLAGDREGRQDGASATFHLIIRGAQPTFKGAYLLALAGAGFPLYTMNN